jgi:hypothetical protein
MVRPHGPDRLLVHPRRACTKFDVGIGSLVCKGI